MSSHQTGRQNGWKLFWIILLVCTIISLIAGILGILEYTKEEAVCSELGSVCGSRNGRCRDACWSDEEENGDCGAPFCKCCRKVCADADDMTVIGGEAYKIITDGYYKWTQAQKICSSFGLILAEPRDIAKEVVAYLVDNYGYPFWVGGRSGPKNTTFKAVASKWVSDGAVISLDSPLWSVSSWCGRGEDCCVHSWREAQPYLPVPCGYTMYVLCQCPSA